MIFVEYTYIWYNSNHPEQLMKLWFRKYLFSLLAFLLEHFFEELRRKMTSYKFSKPKEVTLTSVCQHISTHLNYLRHWKSIYDYVRLRRDNELVNPIKVIRWKNKKNSSIWLEIHMVFSVLFQASSSPTNSPFQWKYIQSRFSKCTCQSTINCVITAVVAICEKGLHNSYSHNLKFECNRISFFKIICSNIFEIGFFRLS